MTEPGRAGDDEDLRPDDRVVYLWPVVLVIDGGLGAVRQMQVGEPECSDLDAVGFQLRDDLVGQEQALTAGYGSVMSGTGSHMSDHPQSRTSEPETLRYRVPDPQDPVVVLSALTDAGFTAVRESDAGHSYVAVACPAGRERDRERIREVISQRADKSSLEGPRLHRRVVFDDEA
jgi:hypothetical protein